MVKPRANPFKIGEGGKLMIVDGEESGEGAGAAGSSALKGEEAMEVDTKVGRGPCKCGWGF